ncbi:hypothetical protein UFOVP1290_91 [uncultured Caudovirales phage]|uniref:Uncharacterized protein n=1 Tax=uncultured Caudovirales phage TaxID=2100421 RepID=A0A6J5RSL6_9CAUD|nr:hypothetical protein UFOVP1290_91 [uncultured Caudovirales phage]
MTTNTSKSSQLPKDESPYAKFAGMPAPVGYKHIEGNIPTGVVTMAKSLLSGQYGTETPFQVDGVKYKARVERHYHPPGFVGGPNGWHKGVTVYVSSGNSSQSETTTKTPQKLEEGNSKLIKKIDDFLAKLNED